MAWSFSNNSRQIAEEKNADFQAQYHQMEENLRQPITRAEVQMLLCAEKNKIKKKAGLIATKIVNSSAPPNILGQNVIAAIQNLSSSYKEEKQLLAALQTLLPRVETLLAAKETLSQAGNAMVVNHALASLPAGIEGAARNAENKAARNTEAARTRNEVERPNTTLSPVAPMPLSTVESRNNALLETNDPKHFLNEALQHSKDAIKMAEMAINSKENRTKATNYLQQARNSLNQTKRVITNARLLLTKENVISGSTIIENAQNAVSSAAIVQAKQHSENAIKMAKSAIDNKNNHTKATNYLQQAKNSLQKIRNVLSITHINDEDEIEYASGFRDDAHNAVDEATEALRSNTIPITGAPPIPPPRGGPNAMRGRDLSPPPEED